MNQGRTQKDLEDSAELCAYSGAGLLVMLIIVLISGACLAGNAPQLDRLREGVKVQETKPLPSRGVNLPIIADGRMYDGHGWCVPIKRGGETVVLTALHVLKDAATFEVRPARVCVDGVWWNAELVKTDAENDLAILRIKCPTTPVDVQQNEPLKDATARFVLMRVPGCLPGWSGSAVLDAKGRLAALIIRSQAINTIPVEGEAMVVPASVIAEFIK